MVSANQALVAGHQGADRGGVALAPVVAPAGAHGAIGQTASARTTTPTAVITAILRAAPAIVRRRKSAEPVAAAPVSRWSAGITIAATTGFRERRRRHTAVVECWSERQRSAAIRGSATAGRSRSVEQRPEFAISRRRPRLRCWRSLSATISIGWATRVSGIVVGRAAISRGSSTRTRRCWHTRVGRRTT